jgi:hypothetical protein
VPTIWISNEWVLRRAVAQAIDTFRAEAAT